MVKEKRKVVEGRVTEKRKASVGKGRTVKAGRWFKEVLYLVSPLLSPLSISSLLYLHHLLPSLSFNFFYLLFLSLHHLLLPPSPPSFLSPPPPPFSHTHTFSLTSSLTFSFILSYFLSLSPRPRSAPPPPLYFSPPSFKWRITR
jgi:hypothetical protein